MSLVRPLTFFVLLASLCACTQPAREPVSVGLELTVMDDMKRRIANVPIDVDGALVATSDAQGEARATVHASQSGRVQVSVRCPEGYESPASRSLPLASDHHAFQLDLVCVPLQRRLAVVVRAPLAEGAWVRVDGQALGRIAEDGTLHAEIKRPPDTPIRLSIDTTQLPRLVPQHPVRELRVTNRDEIIVFDQAFAVTKPPPRLKPRARAPAQVHHRPYAISRAGL